MRQRGGSGLGNTRIADRESDYQRQRIKRMLSPEVTLPFSPHAQRSDPYKDSEPVRGYKEVMKEKLLDEEESRVYKQILEKQQEEEERQSQKRASEAETSKWDAPTPSTLLVSFLR